MVTMIQPEGKIIKCAIIVNGVTYTGWRHSDIRNNIVDTTNITREEMSNVMHDEWKVGFIAENGRFLTRKQALVYGRSIGQIDEIIGYTLTSEDLWNADGSSKKVT